MNSLDPYMREVFPKAPMVAYKRPRNIREFLIRAKLPPPNQIRENRRLFGMKNAKRIASFVHMFKRAKR